jgi:hypothetical protein
MLAALRHIKNEHVAKWLEMRNAYNLLVGNAEGKTSFGRPCRHWENNIKMELKEIGYERVDWLHLAQSWIQ